LERDSDNDEEKELPALAVDEALNLRELKPEQHFTQPPPRYTEASLVKALEKEGIGRPSTYATIINTIQKRGYVVLEERRFHATELGMVVTDKLLEHFPRIMDLKFTSHMEEELDDIEARKIEWRQVLDEFYGPFSEALAAAQEQASTSETDAARSEALDDRMLAEAHAYLQGYWKHPAPAEPVLLRQEPAPELQALRRADHQVPALVLTPGQDQVLAGVGGVQAQEVRLATVTATPVCDTAPAAALAATPPRRAAHGAPLTCQHGGRPAAL